MNDDVMVLAAGTYRSTECRAVPKGSTGEYYEFPNSIDVTLYEDGSFTIRETQSTQSDVRNHGDGFVQVGITATTKDLDGTYSIGVPSGDDPNSITLLFGDAGYLGFFDKSDSSLLMWGLYPDAYLQYPCEKMA